MGVFRVNDWVRVHGVEGSGPSQQASRQYAGSLGRVIVTPGIPAGDYSVQIDGGPPSPVQLPEAALRRVATDEYGDPL